MASLWKDSRTPYFVACFTAIRGQQLKQLKKSTGTESRKLATKIALKLEDAAQNLLTPEKAKLFLNEEIEDPRTFRIVQRSMDSVFEFINGQSIVRPSTRAFCERWLERVHGEVSAATYAKYKQTAALLSDFLGPKADEEISSVTSKDIERFRDAQGRRVAKGTANTALKIVRIIFGAAEREGVVGSNVAQHVRTLSSTRDGVRRAFELNELRRLLDACDDEWRSMVLFGFYTGARLGDIARFTWRNIDLAARELRFTDRKTQRNNVVPLAPALNQHLEKLAGDDPRAPLHPRAYGIVDREQRTGTLSRQFADLLADAALAPYRSHHGTGTSKGRSAKRQRSELTFHALRHTAVSFLKNGGVSDAVAQDIVGHESAEISRLYTHIDDSAKRAAINKLPLL